MKNLKWAGIGFALVIFLASNLSIAQENQTDSKGEDQAKPATTEITEQVKDRMAEISDKLDQSDTVNELSAGILQTIYQASEYAGQYSAFYWFAFTLMVAGVVSFTLQIVLTKFFLLFKMHLNFKEMLSDILGLAISAIGLMLATQAATQNSTFTQSPSAVISATALGVIVGFVFYIWGQKQEFEAASATTTDKKVGSSRK